ncbi:MAG: hypothetical protein ACLTYW_07925 [Collinsella sp.]
MVTATFASPLGEILLAADGRGLTGLWFEGQEHFAPRFSKKMRSTLKVPMRFLVRRHVAGDPVNGAASSVLERSGLG